MQRQGARDGSRSIRLLLLCIWRFLLLLLSLVFCRALDATDSRPEFSRTVWRVQDGLPEDTVQSIQQTSSGHLWVGTTGGAVQFDGAHFSSPFPAAAGSIFCMLTAKDGSVWLGTEGSGLVHFHGGIATTFSTRQGLSDGFVRSILEDRNGHIWIGTDNGLFWIDGEQARRVDTSRFVSQLSVHALLQTSTGRIWVGGSRLLAFDAVADPRHASAAMTIYGLPGLFSENRIKSLAETRDGTLWIGTVSGLDHMVDGHFDLVRGIVGTVRTLCQTSDGSLWVGTIGHGVYVRRPGDAFVRLDFSGSLGGPINTVLALFEDSSHQVWVGSQDGLFRLRSTPVHMVPLPGDRAPDFATVSLDRGDALWMVSSRVYHVQNDAAIAKSFPGLHGIAIRNVFRDRAGSLWLGTDGSGVYHQTLSGMVHYGAPGRLINNFVRAFLETADHTLWVATDEGVSRIKEDRVQNLGMADGLAYFSTRCLVESRSGEVWIGTERGLSHWRQGHFVQDAVTTALGQEKVWSILQDTDGDLWFGTRDDGLYHAGRQGIEHLTTAHGLASNSIYQLLQSSDGRIWISGPNGISSFSPRPNSTGYVAVTTYDLPDGASGTQMYGGRQPSGLVDERGNLWFASTRGAVEVRTEAYTESPVPRIEITGVTANGQALRTGASSVVLSPSMTRLEIAFTPVLIRPQSGLRFRYRLEGFDERWIDPGMARTAAYTNLPHGDYRFRVL